MIMDEPCDLAFRRDGIVVIEGVVSVKAKTTASKRSEQGAPVRAVVPVLVCLNPSISGLHDCMRRKRE